MFAAVKRLLPFGLAKRFFAKSDADLKVFDEEKLAEMVKRFEGLGVGAGGGGKGLGLGLKGIETGFEDFSDLLQYSYCVATGVVHNTHVEFSDLGKRIILGMRPPRSVEEYLIVLYLAKNSVLFPDRKTTNFITEGFILFNDNLPSIVGIYLSKILINNAFLDRAENFTRFYEKFIAKHQKDYDLSEIYDILRLNNKFILKYPNDLNSKIEQRVSELVLTEKSVNISKIMQIYSACPQSHHFIIIGQNIYSRIESNPEEFFDTKSLNYSTTVHFFAKFKRFAKLSVLVEKYIPEITAEMKNNTRSLGVFFMAILRYPLSNEYKNMIIKEIFLISHRLEEFRKKKIITTMINDDNEYFWQNVHKLGVKWDERERDFIRKEYEKLEKMGLIRK